MAASMKIIAVVPAVAMLMNENVGSNCRPVPRNSHQPRNDRSSDRSYPGSFTLQPRNHRSSDRS